jgi:hypothetical protein
VLVRLEGVVVMRNGVGSRLRRAIRAWRRASDTDDGAALALAMVFVIVGGTIVGALLTYSAGVLRAAPVTENRSARVEAVKSAVRMGITMQREAGPAGCFAGSTSQRFNGITVTLTCTSLQVYATGSSRYGIISTSNDATTVNVAASGAGFMKEVDGPVFLNAGQPGGAASDLLVKDAELTLSSFASAVTPAARYDETNGAPGAVPVACSPSLIAADRFPTGTTSAGAPAVHTTVCSPNAWWQAAGDVGADGSRTYPPLPQLPTYERPGPQAKIGVCTVYYPGRYIGSTPLVLNGGAHYFASGVYYFERPLDIRGGAAVVFGEGRSPGCTFDADAAFVSTAPRNHEITGKGATLVLGRTASVAVSGDRTQVRINRRVSSSTTRGSEGMAIRSVSFGAANAAVEIPADVVMRADGSTVAAKDHSITVATGGTASKYAESSLAPSSNSLDVALGAGSVFDTDGAVFTPGAQVSVRATGSTYVLRLGGGVVATRVQLAMATPPASPTTEWFVGMTSQPIQRQVALAATATVGGRTVRSDATMEVNVDRSYAINSWTVDA